MNNTLNRSADGTIELTLTIPWSDIKSTYDVVLTELSSETEVAGFRKGKAPREMVEASMDKNKVYEETIRRLIPKAYSDTITEHKLAPIMMPEIELKEAKEGSDWIVQAKTCERPVIELKDYKKAIADLKASKAPKIVVPGKEEEASSKGPSVDEVLTAIISAVVAHIPGILLEHEVTHQLSQLVDQTKRLGLTVEQYLASTGKSADALRNEYRGQAERNLTVEFALEAIAEAEKIAVDEAEVTKLIATAKTPEEKKAMEEQRYYLTSLLRRQKTIDTLMAET